MLRVDTQTLSSMSFTDREQFYYVTSLSESSIVDMTNNMQILVGWDPTLRRDAMMEDPISQYKASVIQVAICIELTLIEDQEHFTLLN